MQWVQINPHEQEHQNPSLQQKKFDQNIQAQVPGPNIRLLINVITPEVIG